MKEFLNITLEKEVNELLPLRDDLIQTISTVYEILPTFEYRSLKLVYFYTNSNFYKLTLYG